MCELYLIDSFINLTKNVRELVQQQSITFPADLNQIFHELLDHFTCTARRDKAFGLIITRDVRTYRDTQGDMFGFPRQLCCISWMFGFTFEVAFKVEGGAIREVLEIFRDFDSFIDQQIEDGLWNFVSTTREDVTYSCFACSLVLVQGLCRLPHFVTFATTVGLGLHSQILNVAEVTTVEVQIHRIGISTVYQLSHNGGHVVIFVM